MREARMLAERWGEGKGRGFDGSVVQRPMSQARFKAPKAERHLLGGGFDRGLAIGVASRCLDGMFDARAALSERDARLAGHCREGYRLALRDSAYRAIVLDRLRVELGAASEDLWAAIPWIWVVSLGAPAPLTGALASAVADAARILGEWLAGERPFDALKQGWNEEVGAKLALGSTLRSHPFADLRAWSIRPLSAE